MHPAGEMPTHYAVERAADGLRFEEIARLAAEPNGFQQFIDDQPLAEGHYRIRALMEDGSTFFSNIRMALAERPAFAWESDGTLYIGGGAGEAFHVSLTDMQGKIVLSAPHVKQVDVRLLAPGIYFLRAVSEERRDAVLEKKIRLGLR
jgi:hypothetical protein